MNPELQALYDLRAALKNQIKQMEALGSFLSETQKWELRQLKLQAQRVHQQSIVLQASLQSEIPF